MLVLAGACAPFGSAAVNTGSDGGGPQTSDTDGGSTDAASPDAAPADGGPRSACATASHVVCEDFDRPLPWPGWTPVFQPGSEIERDTQLFVSPPASLHVTVEPSTSSADHPSYLRRDLPETQRIAVNANVAVSLSNAPAPNGEIDVIALELEPPQGFGRYFVTIVASSNGRYVLETDVTQNNGGGNLSFRKDLGSLTSGFAPVRLVLDLDAGTVTGEAGGVQQQLTLAMAKGSGASFEIGAAWANNTTGTFSVNIDDVIVDQ